MKVLIRFTHGLGDSVQLTCILRHLRYYHPDWKLNLWALRGKHSVGYGYCDRVWNDRDENQPRDEDFDKVFDLPFYENYNHYVDCQNTKVTNTLREVFKVEPMIELMRYQVPVGSAAIDAAVKYLRSIGCEDVVNRIDGKLPVLIHYEGNTSSEKKNLRHWQAEKICDSIIAHGCVPIILDWDHRSPFPDNKRIFNPDADNELWGKIGTGDAERIAALIRVSRAFIGIDSGPGKCASSTDTPSLIIWRGHHPMQFHEPAENTMHLLPTDHRRLRPLDNDEQRCAWFENHYKFVCYSSENEIPWFTDNWLTAVLRRQPTVSADTKAVSFVLPNGIGDVMWALHKIRAVADGKPIDVILSGDPNQEINHRAVPFLQRFTFIHSVKVSDVPVLVDPRNPADEQGRYRYVPDGVSGDFHFLTPNSVLERGGSLADWLPQHPVDWGVIKEMSFVGTEKGSQQADRFEPFAAFFMGSEIGNVDEGHNRGFLWEPRHWIELGMSLIDRGLNIVLVGAHYDRSYWERYVRPGVKEDGMNWEDRIREFEIGETFAFLKRAKVFVSYQSGLGIVAHYLGARVAMWWRPDGDSIHPSKKVCFDERMAHSWTNPRLRENYIPLIYRREKPAEIIAEMDRRRWLPT